VNEQEILEAVKCGLKELSNYNDDEIKLWINASIGFIERAGVKPDVARSEKALGVITLCVNSLRLREPNFSDVIRMLVTQLALSGD
jgi:hypothetical protein